MSSSVPRYSNASGLSVANNSAASPAGGNRATVKRHNSFTLATTARQDFSQRQPSHSDYHDDEDVDDVDEDGCNDLIPPRPPEAVQTMNNELPKHHHHQQQRITSYEMIPQIIKPSSSMPNGLPNSNYGLKDNLNGSDEGLLTDVGESQYRGSQTNILMPQRPYRSHSRSTSKSYNVSNSNLTTSTTLASSTLSNLSTNSTNQNRSAIGAGGGYGLNSYGSNSNNGGGGGQPALRYTNRTQNLEPRTTPYYYHELMQKSAVFDSDLNLLNPTEATGNDGSTANGNEQNLASLNGSLDNVLKATRKNLDDLILSNSLFYSNSHSSNDLLNNNANGNSSSANTLVDDEHQQQQQHHSLGYIPYNANANHSNPIPAARSVLSSNSIPPLTSSSTSSIHATKRSSHHSLHASNSNIFNSNKSNSNNNNSNNNNNSHHPNYPNEKYVA